jgi:hypothetical protein
MSARWRWLETAGWLALYAGLIGFVLLWNTAPPFYREVFIEASISDWVPEGTRDYQPGTVLSGGTLSAVYAGGWWSPNPDFRWGKGRAHRLVLRPTAPLPPGSRLATTIAALPVWFGPPREITIAVDGTELMRRPAGPEPTRIELPLPRAVAAGEEVTIVFGIDRVQPPVTVAAGDEAMPVGVALYAVALLPP